MKALVIDDEPDVRTPLVASIKLAGYEQVDTAATGEEALGFVLRTCYDLITVDLQMPGISGLEILTVLRGSAPHSVIAIISAYTERITDEDTKYADLVLPKPFHVETIHHLAQLAREAAETRAAIRALSDLPDTADDDAADDEHG